ncbi:alpha/beta fold hydrolase [Bradyrhizobium sp. URHC0002]
MRVGVPKEIKVEESHWPDTGIGARICGTQSTLSGRMFCCWRTATRCPGDGLTDWVAPRVSPSTTLPFTAAPANARIDKAVVAGFDWGARTADIVAAIWPERVTCARKRGMGRRSSDLTKISIVPGF